MLDSVAFCRQVTPLELPMLAGVAFYRQVTPPELPMLAGVSLGSCQLDSWGPPTRIGRDQESRRDILSVARGERLSW